MHIMNRLLARLGLCPGIPGIQRLPAELRVVARQLVSDETPPGWQPLSSSAQARVARGTWQGRDVVLKVFLPRSPLELLKSLFRGSRGVRAARRGRDLEADGFHAPPVLAHGWDGTREILLMQAVPGDSLLRLCSRRLGAPQLPLPERRKLLRDFGTFVGRLHEGSWVHGDLRLGNTLWDAERKGFVLLDNESNQRSSKRESQRTNLVQLNMIAPQYLSRSDRLRVLAGYAAERRLDSRQRKALARQVAADTLERWQQRAARGGPRPRHWVGSSG